MLPRRHFNLTLFKLCIITYAVNIYMLLKFGWHLETIVRIDDGSGYTGRFGQNLLPFSCNVYKLYICTCIMGSEWIYFYTFSEIAVRMFTTLHFCKINNIPCLVLNQAALLNMKFSKRFCTSTPLL